MAHHGWSAAPAFGSAGAARNEAGLIVCRHYFTRGS
jgi:hypothetical protein